MIEERTYSLSELEAEIQHLAFGKDNTFTLSGEWKEYLCDFENYYVYSVDEEWVKTNLSVLFKHGGHGFVHEFIPHNEIWVCRNHHACCNTMKSTTPISDNFLQSLIIHEATEHKNMLKGMIFSEAHQLALQAEIDAGYLKDPYDDSGV